MDFYKSIGGLEKFKEMEKNENKNKEEWMQQVMDSDSIQKMSKIIKKREEARKNWRDLERDGILATTVQIPD